MSETPESGDLDAELDQLLSEVEAGIRFPAGSVILYEGAYWAVNSYVLHDGTVWLNPLRFDDSIPGGFESTGLNESHLIQDVNSRATQIEARYPFWF